MCIYESSKHIRAYRCPVRLSDSTSSFLEGSRVIARKRPSCIITVSRTNPVGKKKSENNDVSHI